MFELTRRRRGNSLNQQLFNPRENAKSPVTLAFEVLYQVKKEMEVNPGKISQYSTLFDYWETEVYTVDPALKGMNADYVLLHIAGLELPQTHTETLYSFGDRGGDMTKVFWFIKIANLPLRDYYNPDGKSFSNKFWDETLIGKLIPFSPLVYVNVETGDQSFEWSKHTNTAVYVRDIKFPTWNDPREYVKSSPFELVYVSPSLIEPVDNMIVGVLIYKINHDYKSISSNGQTSGEFGYDLYNPPNP